MKYLLIFILLVILCILILHQLIIWITLFKNAINSYKIYHTLNNDDFKFLIMNILSVILGVAIYIAIKKEF